MKAYQIYGTGGHALVVAELAKLTGWTLQHAFADKAEGTFMGVKITPYEPGTLPVLIAIGHNATRRQVAERIYHTEKVVWVHPSAICSPTSEVGDGSVILSGAIIQAQVKLGKQCIANIGSKVDHEAVIGDYVHLGPGCYIGGGAVVGEGALIGAGAVVMRKVHVPPWSEVLPNTVKNI